MAHTVHADRGPLQVLWVDDDYELSRDLARYLGGEGYEVDCASDLAAARKALSGRVYDLALVDLQLPDGSGLNLIRETPRGRAREFVIITGHGSVGTAVEALRYQVFDYLTKPIELAELCNLLSRVRHAQDLPPAARQAAPLKGAAAAVTSKPVDPSSVASQLIGQAPAMRQVQTLIGRAAASDINVLIQGESGTGKEVAATCLHRLSNRSEGPFVAFNCGAVSPSLVASELFGHEKGSFTGALRTHRGLFERADGGTLFLDEVTEMPIDLQASLLRVLETGSVLRVGGDAEIPVNVRIVAASNRDPLQAVQQNRFRLDLYFRLQVFPITLPPLRERRDDILPLAASFLERYAGSPGLRKLSQAASLCLYRHDWPGNVRELRNVVERACLLSDGRIEPEHLMLPVAAASAQAAPAQAMPTASGTGLLRDNEQELILHTLALYGGNKTRSASHLGISLKTLYNKLKKFEAGMGTAAADSPANLCKPG